MIGYLRKTFPPSVSSETVKKFSLAPNNESYVINALQFIGVLDGEGKRTKVGHDVFVLGDDAFQTEFEKLIKEAYKDLFEIRSDDAWTLGRQELVSYFRTTDKTSEVIGGRQAGLFQAFRTLAGHAQAGETNPKNGVSKPKQMKQRAAPAKRVKAAEVVIDTGSSADTHNIKQSSRDGRREMAMTVRIEINLPAGGTQETYDAIFKSIRANLIDE
jgi:hypothetical protein